MNYDNKLPDIKKNKGFSLEKNNKIKINKNNLENKNSMTKINKEWPIILYKKKELKKYQIKSYPYIYDIENLLKKNHMPLNTKIFIVSNGYKIIKNELLKRGWKENSNPDSNLFHLKFILSSKSIDHNNLIDYQFVNHFKNATHLTTKVGLCHTLKNCIWSSSINLDLFFPKCFDLNDENDFNEFTDYFKIMKSEAILKDFLLNYDSFTDNKKLSIKFKVLICYEIAKRRVSLIKNNKDKIKGDMISESEWYILKLKYLEFDKLKSKTISYYKNKHKKIKKNIKKLNKYNNLWDSLEKNTYIIDKKKIFNIVSIIKDYFPQTNMNGVKNIWIIKPGNLSRARGIRLFNNLDKIMAHFKSKEMSLIAQKYIENPLIINKRKFDIRQWIVVTDYNPLRVWLYDECYIRFSGEFYNDKNIKNRKIHLTNNCILKKLKGINIDDTIWKHDKFANYLLELTGEDIYYTKIKPQIINIIKWTIQTSQECIHGRKNTNELFGLDLMIDNDFNVWLIEVNSSPSFDVNTVL